MVLIHSDKQILLSAISGIREFMRDRLNLVLHPKKIKLQPAVKGFAFLGAYVYPNVAVVGERVAKNFRGCVFGPFASYEKQAQRVQSYLGLLTHFKE